MVWIREITLRKTSYSPHPILKMDPHTHHTVKTYWLRLVAFYFYHMNTHSTHTFQHFVNSFGNCQQSLVIGALECSFFTRDKKKNDRKTEPTKKKIIVNVSTKLVFFLSFLFHFILRQSSNFCSNRACNFCVFEAVRRKKKKVTMITPFGLTLRLREKMMKRFLHKLRFSIFFGCYIFSSKYINVLRGKMGFHLVLCVCWILSLERQSFFLYTRGCCSIMSRTEKNYSIFFY